ncbi:hypothetical protein FH5_00107 [Priestia endophytica]|nr:hypothetical protein FH5_00107 [Priestia endophytica]
MDMMRIIQYICSISGVILLGFTYYHILKKESKTKNKNKT